MGTWCLHRPLEIFPSETICVPSHVEAHLSSLIDTDQMNECVAPSYRNRNTMADKSVSTHQKTTIATVAMASKQREKDEEGERRRNEKYSKMASNETTQLTKCLAFCMTKKHWVCFDNENSRNILVT